MPLIGGLLVNLFAGMVSLFVQDVSRKLAFAAAAVAMYSALTAAMFLTFRGLVSALSGAVTGLPEMFVQGLALGVPPVAPMCLGTYMTMWTACTVYTWQKDLIGLVVKA